MAVGGVDAEPTFPPRIVDDYPRSMHLRRGREPRTSGLELFTELTPAAHYLTSRVVGGEAECTASAGGSEGANTESCEVVDGLRFGDDRHEPRRSSTRSIFAPRARKRSSMRSYPRSI